MMTNIYEMKKQYEGKMVRFKNKENQWVVGRVASIDDSGIEIEEYHSPENQSEYGYGFFGPRPFYGPRPFRRRPFVRYPYGGFTALTLLPFLLW